MATQVSESLTEIFSDKIDLKETVERKQKRNKYLSLEVTEPFIVFLFGLSLRGFSASSSAKTASLVWLT